MVQPGKRQAGANEGLANDSAWAVAAASLQAANLVLRH
jgi:hypothetical protein